MSEPPRSDAPAERLGRRMGLGLFVAVVSGITLTWAVQIVRQTFFPPAAGAPSACRPGVLSLIAAVRRAREAADAETGGERASVARFRSALAPEWDAREALGAACRGDALGERALREVDRLRFAEEHATRYEAVDLTRRRRDVAALEKQLARP